MAVLFIGSYFVPAHTKIVSLADGAQTNLRKASTS